MSANKQVNALMIDPFALSVKKVTCQDGDFKTFKKVLSFEDDYLLEPVRFDKVKEGVITLLIDEEGLFRANQHFFTFMGSDRPLAGRCLMLLDNENSREFVSLPDMFCKPQILYSRIAWLGDPDGLERNIALGLVERPCTKMGGFGAPMETIWEWHPSECAR